MNTVHHKYSFIHTETTVCIHWLLIAVCWLATKRTMVSLHIGSNVVIRKLHLPGTIVGQDEDNKNIWIVEYVVKGEKKVESFSRWQLRSSKPGDPILESVTASTSKNLSECSNLEDDDDDFPLPDVAEESSDDESLMSKSVHKQCEEYSRIPINNKAIPFGKGVLVVILKGSIPGIIIQAKGTKTWKVKYKEDGIVQTGTFKSKQMRRPRGKREYFSPKENNTTANENEAINITNDNGEESEDDSYYPDKEESDDSDDSDSDPDDDGEEYDRRTAHSYYDADTEDNNHNEGQAAFDEYEMRFAASLEPKDERYDRKVKEYEAKKKKLIDNNFTVTKRKAMKLMGVGTQVIERRREGRKGVIVGGEKAVWDIKYEDGTVESGV